MDSETIENLFDMMPAVVCTAGSNIIATGGRITPLLSESVMGKALFDHMDPFDVIRYTARFFSDERAGNFCFSLRGLYGFSYGAAFFRKVLDRRFAVVLLFENICDDIEDIVRSFALDAKLQSGYDLLLELSKLDEDSEAATSGIDVIDAKGVTEMLVDHGYCPDLYIRTIGNKEGEITDIPLDVPRKAFLLLVMLIIRTLDIVSVQRAVSVRLTRLSDRLEMRFVTDATAVKNTDCDICGLISSCPASEIFLSLIEYTCSLYNATLDVLPAKNCKSLSLVLTFFDDIPEALDFKSADSLLGLDGDIEFIWGVINAVSDT